MRAGGTAPPPPPSRRWLVVVAAVIAIAATAVALVEASTTLARVAILAALAFGGAAVFAAAAAARTRRAVRALAAAATEVTAGGPRRLPSAGDEFDPVATLINRMADDAERTLAVLRGERDLSGSVLDSMTQGVIALDGADRITLINPAARRIFALPGVPIGERFADQVAVPEARTLVAEGRPDTAVEFTTAAGVRAVARLTTQRSGDGQLVIVDDVTAIRRLETIRRDFIANVSHELRTPVSVIRANAETLQSGGKDDPRFADRLIDGLHRNAERLARIIADLLDLSRLDAGHYRLDRQPVEIANAVAQAIASVEHLATARSIAVSHAVPAELSVIADPKALDQVLVNLIDNAVKYASPRGNVAVRASLVGTEVRLEVADDGPGIAAHHRDRIFERFYRVDPGRSRDQGGTGLGLSIVKHLVESMGGSVGVEPNAPTGSVFYCVLPRSGESVATTTPS